MLQASEELERFASKLTSEVDNAACAAATKLEAAGGAFGAAATAKIQGAVAKLSVTVKQGRPLPDTGGQELSGKRWSSGP